MPGKSKKRKGKFQPHSKRKKGRRSHPVVVSQQQAAPRAEKAVAAMPEVAATSPAPAVVKNPELATELRRIGILAGIILTALIILALVLS